MFQHLSLEQRGSTAIVTFARPPANALNRALLSELREFLAGLSSSSFRALVITGQGRFFSAGLDLFEVFSYAPSEADEFCAIFDDTMTALFAVELPVVAAINGHAIAGGAVLAAAADFRLISDGEAKIGLTEIQVGVPFPTSAFEIVHASFAGPYLNEILYRGQNYGASAALTRHMVDEVVPAAELLPRAITLADELGSRTTVAFTSSKRALRQDGLAKMANARKNGPDPIWAHWRTPEVFAAMQAYREKLASQRTR